MTKKPTIFQKINRFFFGPKIGDIYVKKQIGNSNDLNPFKEKCKTTKVKIIDVRKTWVQYAYLVYDDKDIGDQISEWQIKYFMFGFQLYEVVAN